ncbi:MAG TPA: right-handed parallel beta-helix repeat-containing protein [Polyangiaceae bacterium]|nr:right-handed parallel beta-helix repeat-containing protein [Polyangiaceae bacterium]
MASVRFWIACGVSSVIVAACGSSDGKHAAPAEEGGAGGEPGDAGAPAVGGKGGTAPLAGSGGMEPLSEGGVGGVPASGGLPSIEGGAGAGPALGPVLVEPKYPTNGVFWLDYVKNDGTTRTTAKDVACNPTSDGPTYTACVHGGEIRRIALPGLQSCAGVSATDTLGAFEWICQPAGNAVEVVSTGLAPAKHLTDLLDFSGKSWKLNAVAISRDDQPYASSEPAAWWSNPITSLAAAACVADVGAPHDIFVLDAASSNANCTGKTEKIGLVTAPGETVTDFSFNGKGAFNWYEGEYAMQAKFTVLTPGSFGFQVVRNAKFTALAVGGGFGGAVTMAAARASVVRDITASGGRIIIGASSASGLSISDVTSDGAKADAISLNACADCSIERATITNTVNRAIYAQGVTPRLSVRDLTATNNGSGAVGVTQVTDGRIENVRIKKSGSGGIGATLTARTVFKSITVDGANGVGVSVDQGDDNRLVDIQVADAYSNGVFLGGNRAVLQHARISCGKGAGTLGAGVSIPSNTAHSRVYDVTVTACRYGVDLNGSADVVQAVTVADTEDVGFRNASYGSYLEDVVAIDTTYGLYFLSNLFGPPRVRSFASSHNQTAAIYSNNSTLDIAEKLIVGNSGATGTGADCVTTSTTGLDNACGGTAATLTQSASVLASIVGIVTDNANPQGATGTASYDTVTDFLTFGTDTRRYIRAGAAFPDYANRGPCRLTENCAILDVALRATDTLLRNRNVVSTGNDVTVQSWFISSQAPADQTACDARVPGSVFVAATPNRCESTFLKHAWELIDDGKGDDDGLCESDETCEIARNIGGYQGHGAWVTAGAFVDGTLENITLLMRQDNGY